MFKRILSCLLIAWLAQTAGGQSSPERQKKRYFGCHLVTIQLSGAFPHT